MGQGRCIEKIDKALQKTDVGTINLTDPDSREMKKGAGTDYAYAPLRHAMREKVKSPEGRAIYRQRGGEVEPSFGWEKRITLPQFRQMVGQDPKSTSLLPKSLRPAPHRGGEPPRGLVHAWLVHEILLPFHELIVCLPHAEFTGKRYW